MSLYDVLFRVDEEDTKAGSFITKDGRVIFIGGPGSGGGSAGEGGASVTQTQIIADYETRTRDEQIQQVGAALNLHNRYMSEDFTEEDVAKFDDANAKVLNDLLRIQTSTENAMNDYARIHKVGFPVSGSPEREAIYLPLTRVQQVYDTLRTGRVDKLEDIN